MIRNIQRHQLVAWHVGSGAATGSRALIGEWRREASQGGV